MSAQMPHAKRFTLISGNVQAVRLLGKSLLGLLSSVPKKKPQILRRELLESALADAQDTMQSRFLVYFLLYKQQHTKIVKYID